MAEISESAESPVGSNYMTGSHGLRGANSPISTVQAESSRVAVAAVNRRVTRGSGRWVVVQLTRMPTMVSPRRPRCLETDRLP